MPKVTGFHNDDARLRREEMGRRLEFVRTKLSLSKSEFAKLVGAAPSSYTRWIQGSGSPSVQMLSKICEVGNVPASFLNPEKLSDVREVDRFAHELVTKLGIEQVEKLLSMSTSDLDALFTDSHYNAFDAIHESLTEEQIQDVIFQLMLGLKTGMLSTILESNRAILFNFALASDIDVEELDSKSRDLVSRVMDSRLRRSG